MIKGVSFGFSRIPASYWVSRSAMMGRIVGPTGAAVYGLMYQPCGIGCEGNSVSGSPQLLALSQVIYCIPNW